MRTSGPKASWSSICKPRSERGLGFRVLKEWNKAAMAKHLWAVCQKADKLRVKCVHTYVIKEQCLWAMDVPSNASWTQYHG